MDYAKELLSALNEFVVDTKWQLIGSIDELKQRACTRLYVDTEDDELSMHPDDVLLISVNNGNEFYAMDCSCPHEGGPLELGDIEEINGGLSVVCPWHSYDFNIKTGSSSMGLWNTTYETKVANNAVYIKHDFKLSLKKVCIDTDIVNDSVIRDTVGSITKENEQEESLCTIAKTILSTPDPILKSTLTRSAYQDWLQGRIPKIGKDTMPSQPKRLDDLQIIQPGRIKRGKGGTLQSRIALLHSSANIELWAIDLSWDIIGRFSSFQTNGEIDLPREFFHDFIKVADDEAKHFMLLNDRLKELQSEFGCLPVHNGLWQSADETKDNILARLAIVHMVHEARGLDVHPKTKQRFSSQGDTSSVQLMDVIYRDEITHVACGMKWFTYICTHTKPPIDPVSTFHKLVKKHFKGYLKPPFNTDGRSIAGMDEKWYTPLVKP